MHYDGVGPIGTEDMKNMAETDILFFIIYWFSQTITGLSKSSVISFIY